MMKTLLFSLAFICSVSAYSQMRATATPSPKAGSVKLLSPQSKMLSDTLFPAPFGEACADSFLVWTLNPPGEGFVFGSNTNGFAQTLQRFAYGGSDSFAIKEVKVAFAGYDKVPAGAKLYVDIYTDINPDTTQFGTYLGSSESINVLDIDTTRNGPLYATFTFPIPIVVGSKTFLVGVDFAEMYTATDTGYVGILTTGENCGSGGNVIQLFPESGNLIFDFSDQVWGINSELVMATIIDTDLSTATRQPIADYRTTVAPNPTNATVKINFEAKSPVDYRASLSDLTGKNLVTKAISGNATNTVVEWDLSNLPSGIYLYHIDGPKGRQSGKLVKN